MTDKLHQTKGIVLRAVKYGETSLIVSILTAKFGVQSYIINGVRSSAKTASGKASYFQPGAILELVAYHSEFKQLHRLKEYRFSFVYRELLQDVEKNTVMLFMIELLGKCMKQAEENLEQFDFVEDALLHLDRLPIKNLALYPSFFGYMLHIPDFTQMRSLPVLRGILR
ncbi:MAG: DNA repair protein RecO [Pedobacter sp.]|nr:MAG: DNA repair protein RecO [Pedobacter sp.]